MRVTPSSFLATLSSGVEEIRERIAPDPELPPAEALMRSLEAYLEWIEEHADGYVKLVESASSDPEVRALVAAVRRTTAEHILSGLRADGPAPRTAVRGWLWFMDGVCLEWVNGGELDRGEVLELLVGTLYGALAAAGAAPEETLEG